MSLFLHINLFQRTTRQNKWREKEDFLQNRSYIRKLNVCFYSVSWRVHQTLYAVKLSPKLRLETNQSHMMVKEWLIVSASLYWWSRRLVFKTDTCNKTICWFLKADKCNKTVKQSLYKTVDLLKQTRLTKQLIGSLNQTRVMKQFKSKMFASN